MEVEIDLSKYITEKEITDSLLILSDKRLDEYDKKYKCDN